MYYNDNCLTYINDKERSGWFLKELRGTKILIITKYQATVETDDLNYSTFPTGVAYGVNVPTERRSKERVNKEYYRKPTVPNIPEGISPLLPIKEPTLSKYTPTWSN